MSSSDDIQAPHGVFLPEQLSTHRLLDNQSVPQLASALHDRLQDLGQFQHCKDHIYHSFLAISPALNRKNDGGSVRGSHALHSAAAAFECLHYFLTESGALCAQVPRHGRGPSFLYFRAAGKSTHHTLQPVLKPRIVRN